MVIGSVREKLIGIPDKTNVATSVFGFDGELTAGQIREAISGKPDGDHIQLHWHYNKLTIDVCGFDQLPKFFSNDFKRGG
jgi:hypothetical protein